MTARSAPTEPWDAGLQPERTELAWRRSALTIALGSLVAARLLPVVLGDPWWALFGVAGFAAAVVVWIGARRRYLAMTRRLEAHGDRAPLTGGPAVAAMALLAFVAAVAALGIVVAGALQR